MPPQLTDAEVADLIAERDRLKRDLASAQQRIDDADARETFLLSEIEYVRERLKQAREKGDE